MNLPAILLRPFRASKTLFLAFALVGAFVLSASLFGTLSVGSARAQDSACAGVQVYPTQDLANVAAGHKAGTTFCVHDGTYNVAKPVRVDSNDKFIGFYDDSTRPAVVTTTAHYVFDANHGADGALIKGLEISGAVGGNHCETACGKGIYGGTNLTVDDARITGNANNGIGGAGIGLVVKNSEIDHNGSRSFTRLDGGPSQSAGIKSARGSLTVINSRIYDNYWVGVWCDVDCEALTVKGSTITGNGKAGIHDEISEGPAVVSGNTIRGNGHLAAADRHAGLLIMSSANVDAYNNTFGSNSGHGVEISEDARAPVMGNVEIHDNTMNGDSMKGCTLHGAKCANNPDAPLDTSPPETNIDSGPEGTTESESATFAFSSSEAGSTFECSIDGAAFSACVSPQAYSGLTDGSHSFRVRATDKAGNTDPTPAGRIWRVDTTPPATTLSFDGMNDWVSVPSSKLLNLTGPAARTYEAEVRTGSDVSRRQFVYEEGGDGNGFSVEIAKGRMHFSAWSATNGWGTVSASAPVSPETPYHVAVVYERDSGNLRIYLDGALAGISEGTVGAMPSHGDRGALGGVSGSSRDHANAKVGISGGYFGGTISEFAAWNHARTAAQVAEDAKGGLAGSEGGLIVLHKVEEGRGTTLNDSATNKLHAAISGASWTNGP